jgi:hypothetical protein
MYLWVLPAAGSALMIYYIYRTLRYPNACMPGIFNCERYNFIVPRGVRLMFATGALITLTLLSVLMALDLALPTLAISVLGLGIGLWGLALQLRHRAFCMYCFTTTLILLATAIAVVIYW